MKNFKRERVLYIIIALITASMFAIEVALIRINQHIKDFESLNMTMSQSNSMDSEKLDDADSDVPISDEVTMALDYDGSKRCFISKSTDFVLNSPEGEQVMIQLPSFEWCEITSYSLTEGCMEVTIAAYIDAANPESDTYQFVFQAKTEMSDNIVADAVYEFSDSDGRLSILGQKVLGKAGVVFIADDYDPSMSDTVLQAVKEICANTQFMQGALHVSFGNMKFNSDTGWGKEVSISDNTLSVGSGVGDPICMTEYTRSLEGAGMTEEYSVNDGVVLLFGEYEDAKTGYQPFIYQTDSYTMKVMALSQEQLSTAFQSTAEEPLEQNQ